MTKNTKADVAVSSSAKDWKTAAPRTQVYVATLMRAQGASADELKQAVIDAGIVRRAEGFTSHNSYSLQLLANTYGFDFVAIDYSYTDGSRERRYFFRSAKNAATFDAARAEQIAEAKEAEREAARLAKIAQAEKDAKAAKRAAKASDKPAKVARKSRKPVDASSLDVTQGNA